MTEQDYYYAWIIYLGGSLVIMLGWWQFTKVFTFSPLRHILRIAGVVLLFTPHSVEDGNTWMAPALFVAALDPLLLEEGVWQRAGQPIMAIFVFSMLLYIVIGLLWRRRVVKQRQQKVLEQERQELLRESQQQPSRLG